MKRRKSRRHHCVVWMKIRLTRTICIISVESKWAKFSMLKMWNKFNNKEPVFNSIFRIGSLFRSSRRPSKKGPHSKSWYYSYSSVGNIFRRANIQSEIKIDAYADSFLLQCSIHSDIETLRPKNQAHERRERVLMRSDSNWLKSFKSRINANKQHNENEKRMCNQVDYPLWVHSRD